MQAGSVVINLRASQELDYALRYPLSIKMPVSFGEVKRLGMCLLEASAPLPWRNGSGGGGVGDSSLRSASNPDAGAQTPAWRDSDAGQAVS